MKPITVIKVSSNKNFVILLKNHFYSSRYYIPSIRFTYLAGYVLVLQ